MKKLRRYLKQHRRRLGFIALAGAGLIWLLLNHLGSLTGGLSVGEVAVAHTTYGWYGLYHNPLYLPLDLLRSVVFFVFSDHGQTLTRLANTFFGGLSVVAFAWLLRQWHGTRTAWFATALFACSAWTLHVSRLANNDVMYLWALPVLLAVHLALQQQPTHKIPYYGSLLLWGMMLYTPGLIWLLLIEVWWQRSAIASGWKHFNKLTQRSLYVLGGLIWLPLLVINLLRAGQLRLWLGLPAHWPTPLHYLKELVGVPVHLFIRGPEYPAQWLARAPILDIFTLVVCAIGIYFYAQHWRASRTRLLASFVIPGVILISLGGAVSLSLLVPLLFLVAATGIAYLLREWLQVFPFNPLARGFGIGLVTAAIAMSCIYNLRAYFVAWPHNHTTVSTFQSRIK